MSYMRSGLQDRGRGWQQTVCHTRQLKKIGCVAFLMAALFEHYSVSWSKVDLVPSSCIVFYQDQAKVPLWASPNSTRANPVLEYLPQAGIIPHAWLKMFITKMKRQRNRDREKQQWDVLFTDHPAESLGPSCVSHHHYDLLLVCACWQVECQIQTLLLSCLASSGTEIGVLTRNFFLPNP